LLLTGDAVLTLDHLPQVAFVGFAVQALVSRTGPIEGLTKHLADPFGHNITGYLTHLPEVLSGSY
jgi:light-harvesting complex I chlorophyll a/b binding protein 5